MAFGVYGIFFPENYVYIGSTIADFNTRHRVHLKALKDGRHDNSKMQELYNKYGAPDFRILDDCSEDNIPSAEVDQKVRELEQYYIERAPQEGWVLCNEAPALIHGNPLPQAVREKISLGRRNGRGGRKKIASYITETKDEEMSDYQKRKMQMWKEQGW